MNILIVEDEFMVAKRLTRLSQKIVVSSNIQHANNLDDAELLIDKNDFDLVLLDLNLNNRSGFDLLKSASAASFQTIIVSANTDQAIIAFEFGVVDFVPKPFNEQRLTEAFDRLIHSELAKKSIQHLSIKKTKRIELIKLEDIEFIKGAGNYSEIVTNSQITHLHEKSLDKLDAILSDNFYRLHKSYIVNLNCFKSLHTYPGSKYEISLLCGNQIPVSRHKVKDLKAKLGLI